MPPDEPNESQKMGEELEANFKQDEIQRKNKDHSLKPEINNLMLKEKSKDSEMQSIDDPKAVNLYPYPSREKLTFTVPEEDKDLEEGMRESRYSNSVDDRLLIEEYVQGKTIESPAHQESVPQNKKILPKGHLPPLNHEFRLAQSSPQASHQDLSFNGLSQSVSNENMKNPYTFLPEKKTERSRGRIAEIRLEDAKERIQEEEKTKRLNAITPIKTSRKSIM